MRDKEHPNEYRTGYELLKFGGGEVWAWRLSAIADKVLRYHIAAKLWYEIPPPYNADLKEMNDLCDSHGYAGLPELYSAMIELGVPEDLARKMTKGKKTQSYNRNERMEPVWIGREDRYQNDIDMESLYDERRKKRRL